MYQEPGEAGPGRFMASMSMCSCRQYPQDEAYSDARRSEAGGRAEVLQADAESGTSIGHRFGGPGVSFFRNGFLLFLIG
jgi:hypothetical protein